VITPSEVKSDAGLPAAARDALIRNRAVTAWRDFMGELRQSASLEMHPERL